MAEFSFQTKFRGKDTVKVSRPNTRLVWIDITIDDDAEDYYHYARLTPDEALALATALEFFARGHDKNGV